MWAVFVWSVMTHPVQAWPIYFTRWTLMLECIYLLLACFSTLRAQEILYHRSLTPVISDNEKPSVPVGEEKQGAAGDVEVAPRRTVEF